MLTANGTEYTETAVTPAASADPMLLLVPSSVQLGGPARVFLYAHGRGDAETDINTSVRVSVRDAMIDAGYIIVAPYASGNAWSSQTAQDDMVAASAYVDARYQVTGRILAGASMGGSLAAILAANKRIDVDGYVFITPSVSLAHAWARSPDSYRNEFVTHFGINPDGSDFSTVTAPFDPFRFPAADYTGIRAKVWGGTVDEVVSYGDVVEPFALKLISVSNDVEFVSLPTGHMNPQNYNGPQVAAFANEVFTTPASPLPEVPDPEPEPGGDGTRVVYRVDAMYHVGADRKLYTLTPA